MEGESDPGVKADNEEEISTISQQDCSNSTSVSDAGEDIMAIFAEHYTYKSPATYKTIASS